MKVIVFSGSLRKESFTTKLAHAFMSMAPEGVETEFVPIGELPFINQDFENDLPEKVRELKQKIVGADAVLLTTPEYNRSYSPVLKNALDWASRPAGANAWDGKPTAVIGCTPGTLGAFGAVHHLRQVLVFLNMQPMQQPEFYLAGAAQKFNDAGELTDEATKEHIVAFWQAFVTFAARFGES
ncbi:MAG TPA: NAD(P)H-dependent oxidoreductase [Candidatus Saccharimonadales bacterium]